MTPIRAIGRPALRATRTIGAVALFAMRGLSGFGTPRAILRQVMQIGWLSLPVVGLTALFTGMVLALQSYVGFSRFNAESAIASVVVLSVTRELGPVLLDRAELERRVVGPQRDQRLPGVGRERMPVELQHHQVPAAILRWRSASRSLFAPIGPSAG